MKLTKDELLAKIREHGGDEPDDWTISMLEDVSDSWIAEVVDNSEIEALQKANNDLQSAMDALQETYKSLKKAYADRFTLKDESKEDIVEEIVDEESDADEKSDEDEETYENIFEPHE